MIVRSSISNDYFDLSKFQGYYKYSTNITDYKVTEPGVIYTPFVITMYFIGA